MPYFYERTYVVNEDNGISNRPKKKDTSFRSFITYLLVVLLLWIVTYCIILAITNAKNNGNLQHSGATENIPTAKTDKRDNVDDIDASTNPSVIGSAITNRKNESVRNEEEKVCRTAGCKSEVIQILQLMDHSVDHCENFYQFSCGSSKNVKDVNSYIDILLKAMYTSKGAGDKYFKVFREFFDSCVRYENDYGYSKKIKNVLNINTGSHNITGLLAFLMLRQSTPLFEVHYGYINGEGYGFQLLPPDSSYKSGELEDWSLQNQIQKHCLNNATQLKYQAKVDLASVYQDYEKCKKETFEKMAENFFSENLNGTKEQNEEKLKKFLAFFSELHSVSDYSLQKAVQNQNYKMYYIDEISESYPEMDWQHFFNEIAGPNFYGRLHMYLEEEYFKKIMNKLRDRKQNTEEEVIEFLKMYYRLELYQNLIATKQDKEEFCMNQAVQLMPEIASKIFYENSGLSDFPTSLVGTAFEEVIQDFSWFIGNMTDLDVGSKTQYKSSFQEIKIQMFNNVTKRNEYLEHCYENYYIQEDYLSNIFMFTEYKRKERYRLRDGNEDFIPTAVLQRQFSLFPEVIPKNDIILIPNVFLFNLNKTSEYPRNIMKTYLKYHLSRTVALHFIETVRKSESRLVDLNNIFENVDKGTYFDGQEISYKGVEFGSLNWSVVVSFSEVARMADNIALDMTFKSIFRSDKDVVYTNLAWIEDEYSPEKLFYILIAQEFCENPSVPGLAQQLYESPNIPSIFRIENMIMNSQYFGPTFKCAKGTGMNPDAKTVFQIVRDGSDNDNRGPSNNEDPNLDQTALLNE